MKIVQHGLCYLCSDPEYEKNARTFECKLCGCIFEAEKTEYVSKIAIDKIQATRKSMQEAIAMGKKIYICNCPECGWPVKCLQSEE